MLPTISLFLCHWHTAIRWISVVVFNVTQNTTQDLEVVSRDDMSQTDYDPRMNDHDLKMMEQ